MASTSEQEMNEFKTEAIDLLDVAEQSLLALESGESFKNHYNLIFRSFHNLKGAAGMMELHELETHVHHLENILMNAKDGESLDKEQIDFFLKGIDKTKHMLSGDSSVQENDSLLIDNIKKNEKLNSEEYNKNLEKENELNSNIENNQLSEKENENIIVNKEKNENSDKNLISLENFLSSESTMREFISESDEIIERLSKNFLLLEKNIYSQENIDSIYRDCHSLKGSAQLFNIQQLGDLAHSMESNLEPVRDKKIPVTPELVDLMLQCTDLMSQMLEAIRDQKVLDFRSKVDSLSESLHVLFSQSTHDKEIKMSGSNLVESSENNINSNIEASEENDSFQKSPPIESSAEQSAGSHLENHAAQSNHADQDKDSSSTIRVPVALLDRLMTLMGEMVLVRNQVLQYSSHSDDLEFLNLSQRLNVVTSEIQGEMMKTRMQPIGNIMNKFNRMVRDLSKELGKKIEFKLTGAETELDKTLLEAVKDPLTHIVRNSCDHGIESPQDRKKFGKSESGLILLKAYHEGGQVIIEVQDDGRGLNRDKILSKAIEKGFLNHDKAAAMSDRDVMNLIFLPGFSTAAQITNISGRGVGMDVVKSNIEKIGGVVDLSSQSGKGTRISIKIPLTLAIVPAMIVRCDRDCYAIPQVKLVELVRVEKDGSGPKIEYLQGRPVYRLRGNLLPLIDLKEVLKFPKSDHQETNVVNIVVLNAEKQYFGLIVDEIQDTADIVVKPLNRFLKSLITYSGATVLGDGSVAVILDVLGIAQKQNLLSLKKTGKEDGIVVMKEGRLKAQDSQEFLLFKLNSPTNHAVLLSYVHRLEEFKNSQIELSGMQRVVRYRNSILPIISMNEFLNFESLPDKKHSDIISVIVTQRGDSFYGLEVNEILDVLSTDVLMENGISDRIGIMGNLVTSDGIIVVVDPLKILVEVVKKIMVESEASIDLNNNLSLYDKKNEGLNILFAEDMVFFRKQVGKVLENAGHRITFAVDGRDAFNQLESADRESFDLVVSDIEMPQMDGVQLASAIRALDKWKDIPLIALTTRSDKKIIIDALKAGFDVYLEKMNSSELINTINDLAKSKNIIRRIAA